MSRIEGNPRADREALKEEIKGEIRGDVQRRKFLSCGGCLLAAAMIVGATVVFAAVSLAKTGLVDVPALSGWLYRPNAPVRIVRPLAGSTSDAVMREVAAGLHYDSATGFMTVAINEAQLTTLVAHAVLSAPQGSLPFTVKSAQIAVEPDALELFAVVPRKNREATVLLRLRPSVAAGTIHIDVQELAIGQFIVPASFANALFSAFVEPAIEKGIANVGAVGTLVNVELSTGVVRLIIQPNRPR